MRLRVLLAAVLGLALASTAVSPAAAKVPHFKRVFIIVLENEGVEKFEKSWQELLDATKAQLDAAAK